MRKKAVVFMMLAVITAGFRMPTALANEADV